MATFNAKFSQDSKFNIKLADEQKLSASFNDIKVIETGDYERLVNKPQINGVELIGNRTSSEIKVQDIMEEITPQDIDKIIYGG